MKNKLMKTTVAIKGTIIKQDENATVIRLPVTSVGSSDKKDLGGEYFKKTTYFGDDTIQTKFALYDHLMNPEVNPFAPQGIEHQVLGKATLVKTDEAPDDMHRWWDFEVRRTSKYHDYVLALNDKSWLACSTQCFPNGKKMADDGGIDVWLEGEVTLTPTPMDSSLVPALQTLAKSFGLADIIQVKAEAEPVDPPAADPAVPVTPVEEDDEHAKEIAALFADPASETPAENIPADAKTLAAIYDLVKAQALLLKSQGEILTRVKTYIWGGIDLHAIPESGETLQDALNALKQIVGDGTNTAKSVKKGQEALAGGIAKALKTELHKMSAQSADERLGDIIAGNIIAPPMLPTPTSKRLISSIPEGAPGD